MRNYQIDEANEQQPQVLQVNSNKVRLYFDHSTEEREGMNGESITVYIAKFVELPISLGTDALTLAKAAVVAEIEEYDKSDAVNEFFLNGASMWLDDATRTKLEKRLETDKKDNKSETKIIYNNAPYTLPIDVAESMMQQLESYARDCFDKTNEHISAVMAKRSVNTVVGYDYTVGYPAEKPNFTL